MSSLPPLNLTRNEIASFVGDDPRAIRSLEQLIRYINTVLASQIQGLQISEFSDFSRSGDEERNLATKADLNSYMADSKAQLALDIAMKDSRIVKSNRVMVWLSNL